jgi:hypothetical protein
MTAAQGAEEPLSGGLAGRFVGERSDGRGPGWIQGVLPGWVDMAGHLEGPGVPGHAGKEYQGENKA